MPHPHSDPLLPGLLRQQKNGLRRVALFRASRLGDYICATPAIRAFRRALPQTEITLVGLPSIRPLVERSSRVDRFVAFPGAPGIAEQFFDPGVLTQFLVRMQDLRFDMVVQMHGSGAFSNPLALLFGGRMTAGFVRAGEPAGRLDAAFPYPAGQHEVTKLVSFAEFLGADAAGNDLEFPINETDRREARALLAPARHPIIGVHAAAEDATKLWRPDRFAEAASAVASGCRGSVALLGAAAPSTADALLENLTVPSVDLRGRTSLTTLGAVIERLAVLITNDSGPAHVAYALGVPCVTIFGSTSPAEWGAPPGSNTRMLANPIDCRPCKVASCPIGLRCLESVTVEQVVDAASQALRPTHK